MKDDKSESEEENAYFRGLFGCSNCPHFTHSPIDEDVWKAAAIYYGSFTGANTDEAAVAMMSCEPHVSKFGGTAFFARSKRQWHMKWYKSGMIIEDCLRVRRRDNRDILVCEDDDGHQSVLSHAVSAIDMAAPSASKENPA